MCQSSGSRIVQPPTRVDWWREMWVQRSRGAEEQKKEGGASQNAIAPCFSPPQTTATDDRPGHTHSTTTSLLVIHIFSVHYSRIEQSQPLPPPPSALVLCLSPSSWTKRYPSHLQPCVVPPMNRSSSVTRLPLRPSAPHIHPRHQALSIRSSNSTLITVCDDSVEAVFLVLVYEMY